MKKKRKQKQRKHPAWKKAKAILIRSFFRSCYLIGLSLLIPFILTYTLPSKDGTGWYNVPLMLFFLSVMLITVAFFGILRKNKNLGKSFVDLGFMSLVPGVIAGFVSTLGMQKLVQGVLSLNGNGTAMTLLSLYIGRTLPKMKVLVAAYIIIGIFFYLVGTKIKK